MIDFKKKACEIRDKVTGKTFFDVIDLSKMLEIFYKETQGGQLTSTADQLQPSEPPVSKWISVKQETKFEEMNKLTRFLNSRIIDCEVGLDNLDISVHMMFALESKKKAFQEVMTKILEIHNMDKKKL